ncbi:MAG: phosphoribosylformylglycinamidine synthase subunit PurS, partial [Planctomycetota bacterium]
MTRLDDPAPPPAASLPRRVVRIEVHPQDPRHDALGHATLPSARVALGDSVTAIHTADVFLIESAMTQDDARRVAGELLADPVTQSATLVPTTQPEARATVEVHYLPGVMDPVAESTQDAVREMLPSLDDVAVRTGVRYDFVTSDASDPLDPAAVERFAAAHLANAVVQAIHLPPYCPDAFVRGEVYDFRLAHVPLRDLDDDALEALSRDGHLFLSLDEMRAIQAYYQEIGREPTDIELETLAQTWSEHCVHKTLKSTITYSQTTQDALDLFRDKPGHTVDDAAGTVTIHNLLKSTVAAATFALKDKFRGTDREDFLVSVFDDNAGIVKLDETHGIAIKVETHNHPSALEPYGGAATGIGGCIRDIMGTGLVAKPIANTDVFCVAPPTTSEDDLPAGVIHPKRTLQRVVDGVRDYGNRMGIPTVNGAVLFHDDYVANPLVYAGCVGLIPLDKCFGE